ncbi:MAG: SAM-dependent methyltransferase [Deltaproteobacteria bacterium]|nr:SAM-dependent methyltransferase [Deltaproteobacteria bacterium]
MRRLHLYCGSPDVEDELIAELKQRTGDVKAIAPGLVRCGAVVDAVFARQILIDAHALVHKTHAELAAALLDVDGVPFAGPAIDVDAPELPRTGSQDKGRHPLAESALALQETLRKKTEGRRQQGKLGPPTKARMRVVLEAPWTAWRSLQDAGGDVDALTAWPSPFPAGRAIGAETARDAPSSAHRKLEEAFAWLGIAPSTGDVVVDLGAAPGGWTRVLRDRGATVVAVDRAALDPAIARDPLVTHLKKDALDVDLAAHVPAFVVCDVIWEPANTLVVVERALKVPSVRGVVATIKLRRPVDHEVIKRAVDTATNTPGWSGRVKHLVANKLEVTLLMRRD